jgi:hypothetical protein
MKDIPPFGYESKRIRNDIGPKASIRIRDKGIVVSLKDAARWTATCLGRGRGPTASPFSTSYPTLVRDTAKIFKLLPAGTLDMVTLRRDGVDVKP